MNRSQTRTSIAAGAALALLAGIAVWSAQSCRPQKEPATVAERPVAEAPRPTPAPPPSATPKPTAAPSAAPPQPPGPRLALPAQKTRPATAEHCWLVRITDATREASITPASCAHFDGVDPGGVPR